MKRIYHIIIALAAFAVSFTAKADNLTAETVNFSHADTTALHIGLVNDGDKAWTVYQFVLTLPEGIVLTKDEQGEYVCQLSVRNDVNSSLTIHAQTATRYAIVCYSPEGLPLTGTSGTLLTLNVQANDSLRGKQLTAQVSEVIFSTKGGEETTLPDLDIPIKVNASVVLTAEDKSREYGEENPELTYTSTGAVLEGIPMLTCEATKTSPVGTYPIVVSKGSVKNYNDYYVNGTLTVTKAPLTISVKPVSKKQGEMMPAFEVTYDGWKNGETEDVLTQKPTVTCEADEASVPGEYIIMVEGAVAENYEITYVIGTLTVVNADSVTLTAKSYSVEYGEPMPKFEYDFSTEGIALSGEPQITCEAVQGSPVGTYPIVISKGSVTNYNDHYVNGILTITKAPLTVSVEGEYSRYEGEENPTFTLTYSGWKMDDNESVLTEKPVATTTADETSMPGLYPITVSGGAAENYELNYVGGTLTVMEIEIPDSVAITVQIEGFGSLRLSDGRVLDEEEQTVNVPLGKDVVLTALPEEGYRLGILTIGGTDVDTDPQTGIYVIPAIQTDTLIFAIFVDDIDQFTVDGITYGVLKDGIDRVKVMPQKKGYMDHVVVPQSVDYNGRTYKIVGVDQSAFRNCSWLTSVCLPSGLEEEQTGSDLFKRCTRLAAIEWEAGIPLTPQRRGKLNNPNLLYYVKSKELAQGLNNVVTGSDEQGWIAEQIQLSDHESIIHDFYAPKAFTARHISYEHVYKQATKKGECRGWESIALPFDVQSIVHEKGAIQPFIAYEESDIDRKIEEGNYRPFWLYGWTEDGAFKATASIRANTPYILSMPNDLHYDEQYLLAGTVMFSAENVEVKASDEVVNVSGGGRTFHATFSEHPMDYQKYVLNVGRSYLSHPEGSVFARSLRDIQPFEAYFMVDSGAAKEDFFSVFDVTTEIASIEMPKKKNENGTCMMYDMAGRKMNKAMKPGLYIMGGRKVVIR